MQLDQAMVKPASRAIIRRSGALLVLAIGSGAFAAWWLILGFFFIIWAESAQDTRNGWFLTLVLGVGPAAFTVWLSILAVRGLRRMQQLRELAAIARHVGDLTTADISRELQLEPAESERLVLHAATAGIVADLIPDLVPAPAQATTMSGTGRATAVDGAAAPRAEADLTGSVLNGVYALEGVLGSGAMGTVHAARHVRTGQRFAVKTLLPDAQLSERAIRRFSREAKAAGALGHSGIVRVHDFDVAPDGTHYLVMDQLHGETLEDRLARDGRVPWQQAVRITQQLGEALQAAHDAGILHRDLKPANVFLASGQHQQEHPVLLDFGLARPLDDGEVSRITISGMVVGTPAYMSPEQARGEALDARSDVHALGAILYEMVTGEPPFLDQTLAGVYAKLLMQDAPSAKALLPEDVPRELDAVMQQALAKSPDDRFDSVESFVSGMSAVA